MIASLVIHVRFYPVINTDVSNILNLFTVLRKKQKSKAIKLLPGNHCLIKEFKLNSRRGKALPAYTCVGVHQFQSPETTSYVIAINT